MFGNKTLNFSHRGFAQAAPENSRAAFRAALEIGVNGIELDVRTCKSGELVVFHDPTLRRMTDGRGFIKNKTLRELKQLTLKHDHNFSERIPTLEEVLEDVNGQVLLNIEIKTKGLPKDQIETKVVEIVKQKRLEERTIISSFNPVVIRRIKKINGSILTGYLIDKTFRFRNSEIPLTRFSGADAIHLEQSLVKEKLIAKIRDLGYYCVVWTVNDPAKMRQLKEIGVNAIITDRPDVLKEMVD